MTSSNKLTTGMWDLPVNMSEKEKMISAIAGGAMIALGILDFSKSSLRRSIRMTLGTLLLLQARTGYSPMTAAIKHKVAEVKDVLTEPGYSGE